MTDEPQNKLAKTSLSQAVGAKAARKLRARRNSAQGVWFGLGMMGLIDAARRGARYLAGLTLSGQACLDAGFVDGRTRHRLFECVALGGQGTQGDSRRTGEYE
jgi:hypothetical protein